MTDQHPSRRSWPAMPGPTIVTRQRRISLAVLYFAVVINMLLSVLIFSYVQVLKHDRNTETDRIHDQLVHNNCALMDQLPAGDPLDRLRATYHCGPGLPAIPNPGGTP